MQKLKRLKNTVKVKASQNEKKLIAAFTAGFILGAVFASFYPFEICYHDYWNQMSVCRTIF